MMAPSERRLKALYLCYLSLEDPLVHTQVIAYLRGLAAAGHDVHLLTFETRRLSPRERRNRRRRLAADRIAWHGLRYHKRPSLPATVYDTVVGALYVTALVLYHRIDALHARNHVPAAMAMLARRLFISRRPALIFDIRGLMAEEYADAGRWRAGGIPFRLTKAVERAAIRRAAGMVVLTERIRHELSISQRVDGIRVIPCCADVDALAAAQSMRNAMRARLRLDNAVVMTYVGKFGGWYMAAEMATFFAVAREILPALHFLILTQGDRHEIEEELARSCIVSGYTLDSVPAAELPAYLAAADFGISFIRPSPSKASSSPTKIGEYLGAGLPVVATAGIGDLDRLIVPEIGDVVAEESEASYATAAEHVHDLLATREATAARCRAVAHRDLSLREIGVPRYLQLYDDVARRRRRVIGSSASAGS
jgi:glycosyltransferase involved in cell wall biosynthesis